MNKFESKFLLIFCIAIIFSIISCTGSKKPTFKGFEVILSSNIIKSGETVDVRVTAKDDNGNVFDKFNEKVIFSSTNNSIIIDTPSKESSSFTNGVSNSKIKLFNRMETDQKGKIIASFNDIKSESDKEITIKTTLFDSGRIIFPSDPKNKKIKLLNKIERNLKIGDANISNPIMMGLDNNNSFIVFLQDPTNLIVKIASDGSITAINDEASKKINAVEGKIISGVIDKASKKLYILKKDNKDNLILLFFDVSLNAKEQPKNLGKTTDIVKKYVTVPLEGYTFEAIGIEVLNGNPVIIVREISIGKNKISTNRPTFIVLSKNGDVENVMLITPPLITAFGSDYWKNTTIEKFDYQVAIDEGFIYIVWGSGYSYNSSIGYMVQKFNSSGKEEAAFTRITKSVQVPDDGQSIQSLTYSQNEEEKYIARGITAFNGNVYVRIKLDGKDYVDIYDTTNVYSERFNIEVEIGNTILTGPRNMLIYNQRAIFSSDTGIYIFSLND